MRFDYESFAGASGLRTVQPHLLVHTRGRWYLAAWDEDRADWRTFRADRIHLRVPNGPRFTPRAEPAGGIIAHVEKGLGTAAWKYRTTANVHAPVAQVAAKLPRWVVVEAVDESRCVAHLGSDNPQLLALWLGAIDADFEISDSPELAATLRTLAHRYLRAVR